MNEIKPTIKYDDFAKLDIRVGTVSECLPVKNSEKLLKLLVDFGSAGTRQIFTGMAKWYKPEDFVGKQMLFIVNLEPRKMMGEESQGMLLSIGIDSETRPILIKPNEPTSDGEGIM